MILVGTILMVSAFTFVKQLQLRALRARIQKQLQLEEEQRREYEEAAAEMLSEENFAQGSSEIGGGSERGQGGCERITEEEFEYQAKVLSKQSIRQLVTSEAYERLMAVKGTDPANWNWQLHDKQEGYFPTNEEDKFEGACPNDRGMDDF